MALTHLDLGGSIFSSKKNIGDDGARALASAISTNTTLMQLKLSPFLSTFLIGINNLGVGGVQALAGALGSNGTILRLDLSACMLSPKLCLGLEKAQALAQALLRNRALTQLNLCTLSSLRLMLTSVVASNSLGSSGVQVLAEALHHNNTLTHLDLGTDLILLLSDQCS
jgi:hypothetical protein